MHTTTMTATMTRTFNFCKNCGTFIPLSYPLINCTRFNNLPLRYTSTQTASNPDTTSGQPESKLRPWSYMSPAWTHVIGLEIHAHIQANSKLFSGASAALPVINVKCVEAGVLTALALGCTINPVSMFMRKQSYCANKPTGYQITQQQQPIATDGKVNYITKKNKSKTVEKYAQISRLQLIQDCGKSLHYDENGLSLTDVNSAGCAQMVIEAGPFKNSHDATNFMRELRSILRIIGTCDGKMSEGSLRVDANISVQREGQPQGVETKVKNISRIWMVGNAIKAEIQRHIKILEEGGEVFNETCSFDVPSGLTLPLSDKEKEDYRFMPEPNLPPLHVYTSDTVPDSHVQGDVVLIDKVKQKMPTLPSEIRQTIVEKYGISMYYAAVLANDGLLPYFDALIEGRDQVNFFKFVVHTIAPFCNHRDIDVEDCPVTPEDVGILYDMYTKRQLCTSSAVKVMEIMMDNPGSGDTPVDIMNRNNWWQINDMPFHTDLCHRLIDAHPELVRKYKSREVRHPGAIVKKALEETKQRANPWLVSQILKELMSD